MRREVDTLFRWSGNKFKTLIFMFVSLFGSVSVLCSNIVIGRDNKHTAATAAAGYNSQPMRTKLTACGAGIGISSINNSPFQWPCGLRRGSVAVCVLGLWSHQGYGCLSLVSVVCCEVEVSVLGWSLIQRSRIECSMSGVWTWRVDIEEALAQ
jgi:hypothetical protein